MSLLSACSVRSTRQYCSSSSNNHPLYIWSMVAKIKLLPRFRTWWKYVSMVPLWCKRKLMSIAQPGVACYMFNVTNLNGLPHTSLHENYHPVKCRHTKLLLSYNVFLHISSYWACLSSLPSTLPLHLQIVSFPYLHDLCRFLYILVSV